MVIKNVLADLFVKNSSEPALLGMDGGRWVNGLD